MSNVLNFNSEVSKQVNTFDSLPEDRYTVTIEEAAVAPTKAGGEMIKVTFLVDRGKFKGRKLWHQFPLGGKSNIFLFNFLKVINSTLITQDGVTPQDIAGSLKGAQVSVWVEPDKTQNGTPTNKLSKFQVGDAMSTGTAPAAKKPLFS